MRNEDSVLLETYTCLSALHESPSKLYYGDVQIDVISFHSIRINSVLVALVWLDA